MKHFRLLDGRRVSRYTRSENMSISSKSRNSSGCGMGYSYNYSLVVEDSKLRCDNTVSLSHSPKPERAYHKGINTLTLLEIHSLVDPTR